MHKEPVRNDLPSLMLLHVPLLFHTNVIVFICTRPSVPGEGLEYTSLKAQRVIILK